MTLPKLAVVLCGLAAVPVLLAFATAAEIKALPNYVAQIKQLQPQRHQPTQRSLGGGELNPLGGAQELGEALAATKEH